MNDLSLKYIKYLKIERNASPNTIRSYEKDLSDFINFLKVYDEAAANEPGRVNRFAIRAWLGELSEQGLTKSSIGRKISTLRSFFKFAFRRGYINENPAALVSIPRKEKILPKSILPSEIESMFDNMPEDTETDLRDRAVMELFYATGIRRAELIGLNVQDVDFKASQIRVMGKGAKERIIPVGSKALNALNQWLEVRSIFIPANPQKEDQNAVFLSKSGKRIYPMAVQRIVKQSLKRVSEAKNTSPHVLRHSFATHLLNKGADIRIIKELMGHANLTATQVYTSTSVERLKTIYEHSHPRGKT